MRYNTVYLKNNQNNQFLTFAKASLTSSEQLTGPVAGTVSACFKIFAFYKHRNKERRPMGAFLPFYTVNRRNGQNDTFAVIGFCFYAAVADTVKRKVMRSERSVSMPFLTWLYPVAEEPETVVSRSL